nr:hypothetical protein CFP56_50789 [Quercus suber]
MDRCEQVDTFVRQDQERNAFMLQIIQENESLQAELKELRADFKSEKQSRRMWQSEVDSTASLLQELKLNLKTHEFVLVVLDGDGAIFLNEHYARGRDGGAQAAHLLHALIKAELRRCYPDEETSRWQVIVHIVLSARGLNRQLKTHGIVASDDQSLEFSHGWVSHAHTYWTDVGYGKERADHKIREILQMHIPATACKHVFFGPCSDNGYLTILEGYKFEKLLSSKITLIETRPAEAGFTKLGYNIIAAPAVFRATNLQEQPPRLQASMSANPPEKVAPSVIARAPDDSPSTDPSRMTVSSWASISKGITRTRAIEVSEPTVAPRYILLNANDQRLDIDLEQPSIDAQYRFNDRYKDKNLCNSYHLRNQCDAGSFCRHLHSNDLSKTERLVLQHKARGLVCHSGGLCRDFLCFHGHQCKYKNDCKMKPCRFEQFHGIDIVCTADYVTEHFPLTAAQKAVKKLKQNCLEPTQIQTA